MDTFNHDTTHNTLSIRLLGPFSAMLDERPITHFDSNKVRALLAYLAVESDRAHSRNALSALLWPDRPDRVARNNLRQALANLRQMIGDHTARPSFLLVTHESIRFNPAAVYKLDVIAFKTLLKPCQEHLHQHPGICQSHAERLRQATELYRGRFLDQFSLSDSLDFEEWILIKREQLHRLALNAMCRLTDYYESIGEYEQAYGYAVHQLEFDPWREEAHRQVMRVLALSGQRSAALLQFKVCRHALAKELEVEPAQETIALYEHIRGGMELSTVRAGLTFPRFIG